MTMDWLEYVSGQVETIKEIHSLMTSDLKRHYTIEELSKQYLMNTTTLKSVFKAVYGMPIASYMKEYRMKLASNMLLQEDKSISEIAAAVGYKSQSKFTSAFRDIFQILPTAYQEQVSYTNALSSFAFRKSFNTVPISPKIAIPLSSMNSGKN